jgi:hypothetical protein
MRFNQGTSKPIKIVMYEHSKQEIISVTAFGKRLIMHALVAVAFMVLSLAIGAWGYHAFEHLAWIDAIENAAMLLAGMGPMHIPVSTGGKWFATFYALYSGIFFLLVSALLVAPILHRMLHRLHAVDE